MALGGWVAVLAIAGCSSADYYAQAVQGHFALLEAARPLDDWIQDPAADAQLKERLARAGAMREFASRQLGLPDNGSYRSYADLRRPAAVWNVFAAPELSLTLETWCYPVVGCAGYRGYFERARAEAFADTLRARGLDVQVAAVPAYSTLGWFDDTLLNTFIDYPDAELARLLFHELAHQIVYVPDDTVFNESFATAVERVGVQRWLATQADDAARYEFERGARRRAQFLALVLEYRGQLASIYESAASEAAKRERKRAVFDSLRADYQRLKTQHWAGWSGYDRFFETGLGNAHLASVAAYYDLVPAFESVLAGQGGDLPRFYAEVKRLAALPKAERRAALAPR